MLPQADFWRDKRVLVTGHTGFKGAWLIWWLHRLGAQVTGLALAPTTQPSLFKLIDGPSLCNSQWVDLRDGSSLQKAVRQANPQVVLHLAAQALVRTSYAEPADTFATNVMGTVNLLESLRGLPDVRAVVAVTTDKVYHNREWPHPYREGDALGGHDPYSASKAACEIAIASYAASFLSAQGTAVARARAGNVIGGGDWSQDRLIPDAVRAWTAGLPLEIRRPQSVRPWQHVLEPLSAYLILAESIWQTPSLADAYNFGPAAQEAASVRQVITLARQFFGQGETRFADSVTGPHEAGLLMLDNAKARSTLGIQPRWNLQVTVKRTMAWYRDHALDALDANTLCQRDLDAFLATP